MATKTIVILPEDLGHSLFLKPLIERMAREMLGERSWSVSVLNPAGGVGRLKQTLQRLLCDYSLASNFPDLFIVGVDGNCKGAKERHREIEGILNGTAGLGHYVLAIPNAHIEQWMMADPEAFGEPLVKDIEACR